jgi:hypothetical protein
MIDDRDYIGYGADLPDPQWPGGARIAVNINLNFEGGGERSAMTVRGQQGANDTASVIAASREFV